MIHNRKILQHKINESFAAFKNKTAIECGKRTIIYNELENRKNCIAHRLLNKGIAKGMFIGILVDDRITLIATILGVSTAGATFLTLDTRYPQTRLETIIHITDLQWIIVDRANYRRFSGTEILERKKLQFIFVEDLYVEHIGGYERPDVRYSPHDRLYIYFTSGTTGKPKGIVGRNVEVCHFVNWEINTMGIDETFRFSQFTNPGFDVFLRDIFTPLCSGGTLCIPFNIPLEEKSLIRWINDARINLIHCVPSLFRVFNTNALEESHFRSLKYVLLAGEKSIPSELKNWYEVFGRRIQLVNLYGTAETGQAKMFYLIQPSDTVRKRMPVGKHIKGARVIVLNEKMQLCEKLTAGEIYIRTPYRTFGYLNNPQLTSEKFIPNPFGRDTGDLLYKTGDMGRLLPDGNMEVLGRLDRQVKIRGMRVELDEIENVMVKHPLVREAVVVKSETPGKNERLLACLTTNGKMMGNETAKIESLISTVKTFLSDQFPNHMSPADLFVFETIPRTPNGKVNYEEVLRLMTEIEINYVLPTNPIEKKLVDIWLEVLGLEKVGIDNNFFVMGGNSLNVMSLITKIHKEFDIRITPADIFNNPTIETQGKILEKGETEKYLSIPPVEKREYYPLSSAQKRLYFLHQVEKSSMVYNITLLVLLGKELVHKRVEDIFKKMVRRHESLRSSFEMIEKIPMQRVHEPGDVAFKVEYYDITGPGDGTGEAAEKTGDRFEDIASGFFRPFDLSIAPLLRVGLVKTGIDTHTLMYDCHHIIVDAPSLLVMQKELIQTLKGKELPASRIQYKDFSQWQNVEKQKARTKKQEAYWRQELQGELPIMDLPADYPRPRVQDFEGDMLGFSVGKEYTDQLRTLASGKEVTLFMVSLTLFNVLLAKISGQEDIIIGNPIEGRRHEELHRMIGIFINMLPQRNYPKGEKTFLEFLEEVRERTLNALDNQDYQFEDLVEKVVLKRDASRNPLFDVMFQFGHTPETRREKERVIVNPYGYNKRTSKFDLTLFGVEAKEDILFYFEYCTKIFKKESIERFVTYFMKILTVILKDPGAVIAEIDVLSGEEKKQILFDFNEMEAGYPTDKTIHEVFAEQVELTPDNIAAAGPLEIEYRTYMTDMTYISYRELNRKSDQLTRLLKEKGVKPDTIVGIMMERSVEMIIGILGILKAGGAYLPIDPGYPRERIDYMVKDSNAGVLVTTPKLQVKVKAKVKLINLTSPLKTTASTLTSTSTCQVSPASPAYIIYTSGTTGKPKGVIIQHKNVVRLFFNNRFQFDFNHRDAWTLFHSFCFDFSVWEMYGALLFGGQLLLIPRMKTRDPWEFLEILKKHHITVLNQTPSAFYNLMPEALKQNPGALNLRYVIFGGEALQVRKLKAWKEKYPGTKLVNMFGITETTVHVTYQEIGEKEIETGINTIGKPIPTLNAYIMDKYRGLAPLGTPGELWVGGEGVARGYLNQPGLTAEKFLLKGPDKDHMQSCIHASMQNHSIPPQYPITPSPHHPIYRSGDLVRLSTGGGMVYLGRIDQQVQIRGFRVELGEIERQLLNHNGIKEAVVLKREDESDNQHLCAFIVPKAPPGENPLNMTELKDYLSQKLPDYMIPSYFVSLDQVPLTPNGKLDRRALDLLGIKLNSGIEFVAPGSIKEKMVAQTWKEVLKHEKIGINDNFFDLGGNSINIIQIIGKLREELDMDISIVAMFEFPTIRTFSQYLSRLNPGGNPHDMETDRDEQDSIKIDRSGAIESARKSKLKQQSRRKRRN